MSKGYLIIETRDDHPGVVRILSTEHFPELEPERQAEAAADGGQVRFAARFGNVFVARMHAHTALRDRTLDAEAGLYHADPVTAVAAVDAIDLHHEPAFLDPEIASNPTLSKETARRRRRHRRVDRIFNGVGVVAILLLVLLSIFVR